MAQHDYILDNQAGAAFRADLNNALSAIVSQNSGTSAPSTTYANQWWADTTNNILKRRNAANSAWISVMSLTTGLIVGTDVQAYSADTAILTADQSWSGSQRGTVTTDNDLSFDMNAANNFKCTPTGTGALTFTNITAGQSGYVLLVNSGGYAITAAATTKVGATFLSTVSAAGTYLISYFSPDGTSVYCTASGALS